MIVKDEAAHLANCRESVDEIVVVDTGSTDDTAAVASRWGARVYPFRWVDSFAEARNESPRHARGEWIFWLDADERLDEANRERLRTVFARLGRDDADYLMRQDSATDDPHGSRVAVDQVRLFRRDPALRGEYRVHEQILLSIRRAGHDLRRTDVVIAHRGYQAPGAAERKLQRNLGLLVRQDAERPDDPITLYNLGLVHQRLGRAEGALPLLRRSLEPLPGDYSIRPRLFAAIARALDALGRKMEALATCRDGRRSDPDAEDLLLFEAALLFERGDWSAAEATLLHLLQLPEGQQLTSGDAGRRHYKARHLLAEIDDRQGRRAEAEAEWRRVVEEQPRFAPAWQRLGEVGRAGAAVTGAPVRD